MTRLAALATALFLLMKIGCAGPQPANEDTNTDVTRIGVYDSRAIAVAFVGSQVYDETAGKELNEMMAQYKQAEAEGDTKRVEELKAWGKAHQALLHKQAFSTAPVDDILAHIGNNLPEIRKQANVDLLVSKWDDNTLAAHQSAECVDVTMHLIEVFKPTNKQKERAIEIQKHDPLTLEEVEQHEH